MDRAAVFGTVDGGSIPSARTRDLIILGNPVSIIPYKNASVAQLAEQGPLKPKVLGSTPSRRTMENTP